MANTLDGTNLSVSGTGTFGTISTSALTGGVLPLFNYVYMTGDFYLPTPAIGQIIAYTFSSMTGSFYIRTQGPNLSGIFQIFNSSGSASNDSAFGGSWPNNSALGLVPTGYFGFLIYTRTS